MAPTPASSIPPPLTVRNLCATPLRLKLVQRFQAPSTVAATTTNSAAFAQATGSFFRSVTRTVIGRQTTTAAPATAVSDKQASLAEHSPDIRCDAFSTQHTDIGTVNEHGQRETLRLVFEDLASPEKQCYQIDVPGISTRSQELVCLGLHPSLQLTGVFVAAQSWLTLYSSADLQCWMRHLHEATPLSALSIPGTHNSPTSHRALPSVRCQAVGVREQLENGIRFFDVRVQPESSTSDKLTLVHGVFPISMTGAKTLREDVLCHVFSFLDANPSECLILSIKREGLGRQEDGINDELLSKILYDRYCCGENAHRWYTDPRIPSLGQARGKIVLMRRFHLHTDVKQAGLKQFGTHLGHGEWAIDASTWADNSPCDVQRQLCVQDFYGVMDPSMVPRKREYVCAHLARAAAQSYDSSASASASAAADAESLPFHLNFLTSSNFFHPGCWPERIAALLNPGVVAYLATEHARQLDEEQTTPPPGPRARGGTGIVVTDWCGQAGDWDLVRSVVGMNARLEA